MVYRCRGSIKIALLLLFCGCAEHTVIGEFECTTPAAKVTLYKDAFCDVSTAVMCRIELEGKTTEKVITVISCQSNLDADHFMFIEDIGGAWCALCMRHAPFRREHVVMYVDMENREYIDKDFSLPSDIFDRVKLAYETRSAGEDLN